MSGRNHSGSLAKAMMNVSRYRASGITHSSGTEAMSVVMWKVTPSIRLDGTKAYPTQRRRSNPDGDGPVESGAAFGRAGGGRSGLFAATAQNVTSTNSSANPPVQSQACWISVSCGSIRTGYASSEIRLPALLAAYRKYGSLADSCPVKVNHFCSSGALVETTRNGRPIDTLSSSSTPKIGYDSPVGASEGKTATGEWSGASTLMPRSQTRAVPRTTRCNRVCGRAASRDVTVCEYR